MIDDFADRLDAHVKQVGLPLRRIAHHAGLPHQTLDNWLRGSRPRWHPALPEDIRRLGLSLGLDGAEIDLLLEAAGCLPRRTMISHTKEIRMWSALRMPKGWLAAGSHPADYKMGLAADAGPARGGAVTIKAGRKPQGFATLMQQFKADAYRGKRLRFSAEVRAAGVKQWAGLWMRVDGPGDQVLAFDNMQNRSITGTRDWEGYAVVLDVPEHSAGIAFGILLAGPGQVWMAGVKMEPVDLDAPTTNRSTSLPDQPENLSFEE